MGLEFYEIVFLGGDVATFVGAFIGGRVCRRNLGRVIFEIFYCAS